VLLIARLDADQKKEAKKILRQRQFPVAPHDPDGLHLL
jgi:hypothetical protein